MLGTSNNHMCANNVASVSLNALFAESLGKLETIMSKRGDAFRAKAYKKAQETVLGWPTALTNVAELKGAPGIGASVFDRLLELFQTGVISLIEEEKNNPINLLTDVYGIGPKKAVELVNVHGVTSIEQLRSRSELLNDVQRVGLKYYEDILQRIPRTEIQEYEKAFSLAATKCAGTTFEIVGSYRRGAAHSGDIDVIITSTDVGAFKQFVDHLIREKVILEVLSRGDCKCLVITRLPGHVVARRVDFLFSSKEEYAFAILYFTGSKAFNTNMRQKAIDMGYSLNEHCISAVINGKKVPVSSSFPTEKHIFDFLKMDYVVPSKRGDVAVPAPATLSLGTTVIKTKKNVTKKRSPTSQKGDNSIAQTIRAEGFINKVFDKYDETQLKTLLKEANNAYHNVVPFLSDAEFDALEAYIVGRFGSSGLSVGAPVPAEAGGKATLPYKMASMNKIKPGTGALAVWKQSFGEGPFVLSSKLDGVSGLLNLVAGSGQASLYTRGDGETGQDVRWLIPYLGIPLNHDLSRGDICVRGEFIIPKNIFDNKYKTTFANPRNMVAGLINHKHMDAAFHEKIKDVHFVAYEVIHPVLKPSEQFAFLKKAGFECAHNHVVSSPTHLTEEHLSQVFGELKSGYLYETDGVIVCEDKVHPRPSGVSNPEYAFAFKMAIEEQMTRARVVAVHWSASKDGYLKPRVQIEPVTLCGVKIEYATGFNAAFIVQHRVGTGAAIEIIRSGDVIPHIKQVIAPATLGAEAGLPTDCEYEWNETGVDIVLKNAGQDEGVVEKNVALFFAGMGVDGIGAGVVKKLCKAGFNSVPKIIHMTKEEMAGIDGLGEKSALKIKESIATAIKKAEMVTWAAASNIFGRGFGERKMAPILEMYPNILLSNDSKEEKIKQVLQVKGIAEKSATTFVENIARFNAFFVACNGTVVSLSVAEEASLKKDASHALFNKTVVLTGFRDKNFMQKLKEVGAIQGAAVSKNTFAVVVKNEGESSSKISNAKSLGVPIFFLQDFLTKFFD